MEELRKLAAARDKKRDVAALTMNMAISAAQRTNGDPACPVCAAYSFPIATGWPVGPATWGTKCLECGADILIGDTPHRDVRWEDIQLSQYLRLTDLEG